MNKEELLRLKDIKLKQLEEIEKQLEDLCTKEFLETKDYIGKYYRVNNSNCFFHVTDYNPYTNELLGESVYLMVDSFEVYDAQYLIDEETRFDEISREEMYEWIKESTEDLIKKFMGDE